MNIMAKGKVEAFRLRIFGVPMQLTRLERRAWPRTDRLGTEYRVAYIIKPDGTREARRIAKTGRSRRIVSCKQN